MASTATATHHAATPSPEERVLTALDDARAHTLQLVAHLDEQQLTRVHSPIMSPLVWDLGHIAAYEDLWLAHRLAGLELLRPDLADVYDAFETPRAVRGEIEALGVADARAYLHEVRTRVARTLTRRGVREGEEENLCEMVVRHELQHCETMRQTLAIADLLPAGEPPEFAAEASPPGDEPPALAAARVSSPAHITPAHVADGRIADGREEWLRIPADSFAMGAAETGFAYDNERPRHTRTLEAFAIARRPVTTASWMRFERDGGYERREWWSDEGWAWKEEHDITHHPALAAAAAQAPACHVSWFEADAFARAHDARLPSEAEWERAATWNQQQTSEPVEFAQVGRVWEWTASAFGGYPGFVAYPYREYSEVFFGKGYRVLRGGSWASSPRVKTLTFRNWDLPQRRQIFAGVRLARDVA